MRWEFYLSPQVKAPNDPGISGGEDVQDCQMGHDNNGTKQTVESFRLFSYIWEMKYKKIKIGAKESNKANKIICGAKQLKTLRLIDTKKKFTGC